MKHKIFIFCLLLSVSGSLLGQAYIDDIYYTPDDARRESQTRKPKIKNGAKEIIYIVDEDTIAVEQLDTVAEISTIDNEYMPDGEYLNGFNGSESDFEYANRIARFHNPKYAVCVGSPAYNDIYFLDNDNWNVYVSGCYAYVTPTWTNPYYFDYMYSPYSYNSWSWLYNPYGYWSSAYYYGGWNYGMGFGYGGFYNPYYWGDYGYEDWPYRPYSSINYNYTANSRRSGVRTPLAARTAVSERQGVASRTPYTVISGTGTRSLSGSRGVSMTASRNSASLSQRVTSGSVSTGSASRTGTDNRRTANGGTVQTSLAGTSRLATVNTGGRTAYSTTQRTATASSRSTANTTVSNTRNSYTTSSGSRSSYSTTTAGTRSSYSTPSSGTGRSSYTPSSSGSHASGGSYSGGSSRSSGGSSSRR